MDDLLERKPTLAIEPPKLWRNLWFLKDGSSHPGCTGPTTKEICEECGRERMEASREIPAHIAMFGDGHLCPSFEISHFITVPVGES